jgi:hypothetical protein
VIRKRFIVVAAVAAALAVAATASRDGVDDGSADSPLGSVMLAPWAKDLHAVARELECDSLVFLVDSYQSQDPGQGFFCDFGPEDTDVVIVEVFEDPATAPRVVASGYADGALMGRQVVYGRNWYALGDPTELVRLGASRIAVAGPTAELLPAKPLSYSEDRLLLCQQSMTGAIYARLNDPEFYDANIDGLDLNFPGVIDMVDKVLATSQLEEFAKGGGDLNGEEYEAQVAHYAQGIRDRCLKLSEGMGK